VADHVLAGGPLLHGAVEPDSPERRKRLGLQRLRRRGRRKRLHHDHLGWRRTRWKRGGNLDDHLLLDDRRLGRRHRFGQGSFLRLGHGLVDGLDDDPVLDPIERRHLSDLAFDRLGACELEERPGRGATRQQTQGEHRNDDGE
jgi:hypothetical protein